MSIHNGHRDRLKKRFREEGLDNFEELQVLELLLKKFSPPQKILSFNTPAVARAGAVARRP